MADTDLEPAALDEPPFGSAGDPPIDGEPPVGGTPPRRHSRVWMAIAVAVAVVGGFLGVKLASGGTKAATATTVQNSTAAGGAGARQGGGLVGTLASVSGDTLIVTTQSGVKTIVHTSPSTTFTRMVNGSVTDIKVGDHVVATGASTGANHVTAQRITDSGTSAAGFGGPGQAPPAGAVPPDGAPGNGAPRSGTRTRPAPGTFATGTVESISGTTVVVTATDGTATTVDTGSSTSVSVVKTISLHDLTTGETVRVQGATAADGSVTATTVREGAGGFGPGGFGPGGPAPGAASGSGAGA